MVFQARLQSFPRESGFTVVSLRPVSWWGFSSIMDTSARFSEKGCSKCVNLLIMRCDGSVSENL